MAKRFLTIEEINADPVGVVYDAIIADLGRDPERIICNIRASLADRDYPAAFTFAIALEACRQRDESRVEDDANTMRGLERFERAAELLSGIAAKLPPREAVKNGKA